MADFLAVLKDARFYCRGGLPFSFHPVLDLGLRPSPDLGGQTLLETNTPGGATWLPGPDFSASVLVSSNNTCQLTDRLYVTLSTVGFHKLPSSLLREHPFVPDCPMHANVPTDAAAGQTQVSFLLLHICESLCAFAEQPNPRRTQGLDLWRQGSSRILFWSFPKRHAAGVSLTSGSFGGTASSADVVNWLKYQRAIPRGVRLSRPVHHVTIF